MELYTITRVHSLMKPPRIKLGITQDASIVQAGSLLLFDILVVVPTVIPANLIAEFIPYSIGALSVLGQPSDMPISLRDLTFLSSCLQ
jgi:hypothetical protein